MRTLRRASAGYLWRHPWQLALAVLGIAIGVAVIVAVDMANNSARRAFTLSMDAVTGKATHQVIAGPAGVPESLYTTLRVDHGIDRIAPVVEGFADVRGTSVRVLGLDPFAELDFRALVADAGGNIIERLLTGGDGALLTRPTASRLGLAIGDRFTLTVEGQPRKAELVGFLAASDAATDALLATDIATAQAWFGRAGMLTRIDVVADRATQELRLRKLLPPSARLLSAAGRTRSVAAMSEAFSVNLTAMSLLALLVAVFLIYNSVSFAVLQRRRLIAILRALGVTRAQVVKLILGEAVVLGMTGAIVGLLAGIWLGSELLVLVARSINDLYFRLSVTELDIDSLSLLKGFAAGLVATLLAALVPAIEAAAYRPRLAMQRISIEQRVHRLVPGLTLTGCLLAVSSWPLLALSGNSLVAGLLALFMLIIGMALCIPKAVLWWSGKLIRAYRLPGGRLGRLALAGVAASLSRTGVAIVALAVAVSATIGVSVMVGSFRLAVSDWLDNTLQSDIYVSAEYGELLPDTVQALARTDGVSAWSSSRRTWLESDAGRTRLVALRMAPESYRGTELLDANPDDVWPRFRDHGAVLVSEAYAFQNDLHPGDTLTLATARGPRAFEIAASYRSYDSNPAAVIISRSTYDRFWNDSAVDAMGLYVAEGSDIAQVMQTLRDGTTSQPLQLRSNGDLRALSLAIFDRTFVITNVLYWLAIGVAIVGILAAMLALQMERSRELATLRALGVTRRQLGAVITLQSGVIGLWSGMAAVPLGLVMAWMLVDVINRRAFGWSMDVTVQAVDICVAVALAVGSALLAGLLPAWQAGQRQPALAMRED